MQPKRFVLLVQSEKETFTFREAWAQADLPYTLEIALTTDDALRHVGDRRLSHVFLDLDALAIRSVELVHQFFAQGFAGQITFLCATLNCEITQVQIAKQECVVIKKPVKVPNLRKILCSGS